MAEAEKFKVNPTTVYVPDGGFQFPPDAFQLPQAQKPFIDKVLIPKGLVTDRIEAMADEIRAFYGDTTIHCLCCLKGAFTFFSILLEKLKNIHGLSDFKNTAFSVDFVRVSSYEGLDSTGCVKIAGGFDLESLRGKHVLVVEDMIDTGKTMEHLLPLLKSSGAASVRVACLMEKRTKKRVTSFVSQFCGFSIPDFFVVGFNIDYNDWFRDTPHVCVLNEKGIAAKK